jgi:hypothetical protein
VARLLPFSRRQHKSLQVACLSKYTLSTRCLLQITA